MTLEDVEQIARSQGQLLVEQVAYITFLVGLRLPAFENPTQYLIVFVHRSNGVGM